MKRNQDNSSGSGSSSISTTTSTSKTKRIKPDPLNEIKKLMKYGKNDDVIELIKQKTDQLDTYEEKELVFSTIEAASKQKDTALLCQILKFSKNINWKEWTDKFESLILQAYKQDIHVNAINALLAEDNIGLIVTENGYTLRFITYTQFEYFTESKGWQPDNPRVEDLKQIVFKQELLRKGYLYGEGEQYGLAALDCINCLIHGWIERKRRVLNSSDYRLQNNTWKQTSANLNPPEVSRLVGDHPDKVILTSYIDTFFESMSTIVNENTILTVRFGDTL